MILVDTSIWVDHFRSGDHDLQALLDAENVIIHPFVIGELSLGHIHRYDNVMETLTDLPSISMADDPEVRLMIRGKNLFGIGVGYVDAHLLASVFLSPAHKLWTRDKRLHAAAQSLGVAMPAYLH